MRPGFAALIPLAILLGGCAAGDVTSAGAESSYKEQEKKAEALAKQRGEAVETPTAVQGEN